MRLISPDLFIGPPDLSDDTQSGQSSLFSRNFPGGVSLFPSEMLCVIILSRPRISTSFCLILNGKYASYGVLSLPLTVFLDMSYLG